MKYDIIHFEALGDEAIYLKKCTEELINKGFLEKEFKFHITPLTLQDFCNGDYSILPDIISTKTHSKLPSEYINSGNKKSIITRSAGYDHYEHLQSLINLTSLREYCVDAVAQTAIKFMYCICGNLNEYTKNTACFERKNTKSFKELNCDTIVTIFGVGKIGSKVYDMLKNIGLKVQAVDIRKDELRVQEKYRDYNFVSKEEAILNSDIIINVMNLTKNKDSRFYNLNYFSENYLKQSKKNFYFINVTRGEIAPERTILKLYNEGIILGIATDVFSYENDLAKCLLSNFNNCNDKDMLAAKFIIENSLNRNENFYVQPHQGFNSDLAAKTKAEEALNHVVYWFNNKVFKEQLPYYK